MSEENNNIEEVTATEEKKKFLNDNTVEILVAIFLGITALLTAWASWIGSLHGGNQSTNYTKSNNLASEGNAEYNAGMQLYLSDLLAWNTVMDYTFSQNVAIVNGNEAEAELIAAKINTYVDQNCSSILVEAAENMEEGMTSPFQVPGTIEQYFVTANELLEESRALLDEGQRDNANGDAFNLVNVIYSVVLFMLGIVGIFRKIPNRAVVLLIAVVGLVLATVYMFTLPMPTGFDFASFFAAK